jgi:hypothetical protein
LNHIGSGVVFGDDDDLMETKYTRSSTQKCDLGIKAPMSPQFDKTSRNSTHKPFSYFNFEGSSLDSRKCS